MTQRASSANLAEWGDHAKNAIDFLLASSVLPGTSAFVALCTALESVQEAYIGALGKSRIVGKAVFSRLRGRLQKTIKEHLLVEGKSPLEAEEIVDLMKGKLPELNRTAFRSTLEDLFRALKIDSSRLDETDYHFLKIRNEIIHAGITPSPEELALQMRTLGVVVGDAIEAMMSRPPRDFGPL